MTAPGNALREGFTTGTAAAAAGMAALQRLLEGHVPPAVSVPLPPFTETPHGPRPAGRLTIPVLEGNLLAAPTASPDRPLSGSMGLPDSMDGTGHATLPAPTDLAAWAVVEKDGGDDPDATHKAHIVATVRLCADTPAIRLEGGQGVGRVTLPGLPVPVGEAAINPVPQTQIRHALREVAAAYGYRGGLHVVISVPDGARLARHTFNPRLGIVGGISILGTQGTVRPYSHDAWKATIVQGMNVAEATGCASLCMTTGRRSERLLMDKYPQLPAQAFVQVADFAEFSLREAGLRPFAHLVWGCFFGKLVKLAQGHASTHAHDADLDFSLLARWCAEAGAARAADMAHCVTAGHALDTLLDGPGGLDAVRGVAQRAAQVAQRFSGRPVRIHVFHIQGTELVRNF